MTRSRTSSARPSTCISRAITRSSWDASSALTRAPGCRWSTTAAGTIGCPERPRDVHPAVAPARRRRDQAGGAGRHRLASVRAGSAVPPARDRAGERHRGDPRRADQLGDRRALADLAGTRREGGRRDPGAVAHGVPHGRGDLPRGGDAGVRGRGRVLHDGSARRRSEGDAADGRGRPRAPVWPARRSDGRPDSRLTSGPLDPRGLRASAGGRVGWTSRRQLRPRRGLLLLSVEDPARHGRRRRHSHRRRRDRDPLPPAARSWPSRPERARGGRLQPALQRAAGRGAARAAAAARRDERPAACPRPPLRARARRAAARPAGRAPPRPSRVSPLRGADAATRRAGRVPQGAGDPDRHPLSGPDPSSGRRRALRAAAAAANGAAGRGDPLAADLGRPRGRRDRSGGRCRARVLRSLIPLRILQLYPKADYFTGAAVQLCDLATGLAARGHAVTVATPPNPLWAERLGAAGVAHLPIPNRRPWDVRAAFRIAQLIRARDIQVAHAHKGRARTLALLAGLLGARPRLVLNRGVSFRVPRSRRLGYTSRRVHAIVAVCESIKRDLVATGVPAEKIEVIYSGTDVERFHPRLDGQAIRRELGLTAEHFLVTQIGVRSWRGWRDVLDAMAHIAPAVPRARLLFVGAPAPR